MHESRGRPTSARNLHLTVLFVGEVADEQVPLVLATGAETTVPSFELVFDEFETLSPSNVLCLASSRKTPPELLELAEGLRFSLLAREVKLKRQVLRPHVTLARKLARRISRPAPASYGWQVAEFVLVESTLTAGGSQYEVIGRWPLAPRTG